MPELLIATKNAGKIKELEKLLADLPMRLCSMNDFPDVFEPEETGATFVENANLKARYYALQTGVWSLADDSGLEVEALNNAPGVLSARYAGKNADDRRRTAKLLEELNELSGENRKARFVCAMAVADETGEIKFTTEGVCGGEIARAARGAGGFGYDPIFIPDGFSETFGELSGDIKQQISHRARASAKINQYLRHFYAISG
jgi:XTP/dITP diphosphohydrolase